jgi:hypothetical protein
MRNLSSRYQAQPGLDPWGPIHNTSIFAVWNGKTCFLKEISDEFPNAVAFWIDSGSIRESIYHKKPFPDERRLDQLFLHGTDGRMVYAFFRDGHPKRKYPVRMYRDGYAIGGFSGGDHRTIQTFFRMFWRVHNYFVDKGEFVGCEQCVLNTVFVYSEPSWIQPNYLTRSHCNPWFATFSSYGDTALCFDEPPPLFNSTRYIRGEPLRRDRVDFA